jgi:hypothetical protein
MNAVVVPACLSARYAGPAFDPSKTAELISVPNRERAPPSISVVVAGDDFERIEKTVTSLATQVTAKPVELVLVLDNAQSTTGDRLRELGLQLFPPARILECAASAPASARWNLGVNSAAAEALVLLRPGTTFADETGLEDLARWATASDVGLVAALPIDATGSAALATLNRQDAERRLPWPLPSTTAGERLCCWALSRQAWLATGGFDESRVFSAGFDIEYGLRLARLGYRNMTAGAAVRVLADPPELDLVSSWALAGLYPEVECLDRQAGLSPLARAQGLSFVAGRVRYAGDPDALDRSRADFLARTLLENRRRAIEQRAEFLTKLSIAVQELSGLEDSIAGLRRCLGAIDSTTARLESVATQQC